MARDEAYRRAEQKIEEVRRSGAKTFNLGGLGKTLKLTELPESLGQLTQLQSLDLPLNRLTALPEWLAQLTHLQSLDLSGNQLTMLPQELVQLSGLNHLYLHGNPALGLPSEVLGPNRENVRDTNAKPAAPQSILEYYFSALDEPTRH